MMSDKDAISVPTEKQCSNAKSDLSEDNENSGDVEDSPSASRKRKHENTLERSISAVGSDSTVKIICSEQPTCVIKKRYEIAQVEVDKLHHQLKSFKEILEDMKTEMNELSQNILQFNNNVPEA